MNKYQYLKKTIFLILLIGLFSSKSSRSVVAQNSSDTLKAELEEITVIGYTGNRSILETPGSISYIDTGQIEGFSDQSLVYGLNTVAGVKMDERAPGSYRVAIRGSAIRSPFGVRNVKVYWNGLPLTLPSGSTPLNILNNQNIKQVEVIKGPAGSLYGAGTGGVLLINSFPKNQQSERIVDASFGNYGTLKYSGEYNSRSDNMISQYKYSSLTTDGYREQSFLDRKTFETGVKIFTPKDNLISISSLYSILNYGIPGGLNEQQFQDDPQQARSGSISQNSSIDQEDFILGAAIESEWTETLSGGTNISVNISKFENPFLFDYKSESRKSWATRPWAQYKETFGEMDLKLRIGAENQFGYNNARNYQNDGGVRDTLNFEDEIEIQNRTIYLISEIDLSDKIFISAGLSYNSIKYDINRVATKEGGVDPDLVSSDFEPAFMPRIAVAYSIDEHTTVHSSISAGFSPPTLEEFRTNDGQINEALEPEKGINYEIGIRGNSLKKRFNFDVTIFYFRLTESIVLTESERDGTLAFTNAGETKQFGIEASRSWNPVQNSQGFISDVSFQNSYTFHYFTFDNYIKEGEDFSGNRIPGVAPHTFHISLNLKTRPGLYTQLAYNFTDEIPLNDANSVNSDSYHLVKGKVGAMLKFGNNDQFEMDIYAGIDNLLDERYSLGFDVNPFGGRYYQPAPPLNWFGGIKFNYAINNEE